MASLKNSLCISAYNNCYYQIHAHWKLFHLNRIMSEKLTFWFQKHFDLLDDDDDIINGSVNVENIEPPVSDIEDLVSDEEDEPLDKAR